MQKFFKVSLLVVLFLLFVQNVSAREPWAPCNGITKVTQSGTWQSFTFTCDAACKFDFPSTYECETQVYNKKFADYDDSKANNWGGDLPRKYLDTQASDYWPFANSDVENFTVGSAEARLILGKVEYSIYMKLKPESVKTATVRIRGQKGYRKIDFYGYRLIIK